MKGSKVNFGSIDEYIASFPKDVQQVMEELRATIKAAAPEAGEKISYNMPTFTLNGTYLVYFAGWKNHIAFYGAPRGSAEFKEDLSAYESGQGTLKFPFDKPMPLALITKIVKFRVAENLKRTDKKKQSVALKRSLLMVENFLAKLFEHNSWANLQIIQACSALIDEQLDAEPQSVTKGSIRRTLLHLVTSQQGYLSLLTIPVEERLDVRPTFAELQEFARKSGEGLLALARGEQKPLKPQLQTRDGYFVEPWVVMLQVINHATEHREQIKSMLSSLGVTPPDIDGWDYGEATNALIPIST